MGTNMEIKGTPVALNMDFKKKQELSDAISISYDIGILAHLAYIPRQLRESEIQYIIELMHSIKLNLGKYDKPNNIPMAYNSSADGVNILIADARYMIDIIRPNVDKWLNELLVSINIK